MGLEEVALAIAAMSQGDAEDSPRTVCAERKVRITKVELAREFGNWSWCAGLPRGILPEEGYCLW